MNRSRSGRRVTGRRSVTVVPVVAVALVLDAVQEDFAKVKEDRPQYLILAAEVPLWSKQRQTQPFSLTTAREAPL